MDFWPYQNFTSILSQKCVVSNLLDCRGQKSLKNICDFFNLYFLADCSMHFVWDVNHDRILSSLFYVNLL